MPTERWLPDKNTLTKWHEAGLSYPEMADRWFEESGVRKTPAAFGQACRREGLFRNLKHDVWLPRNMRPEHQKAYDSEMIRRWSAREQGKKFSAIEDQRINGWLQNLRDADAILWYDADTQQGWWPVKRQASDDPNVPVRLPVAKEESGDAAVAS